MNPVSKKNPFGTALSLTGLTLVIGFLSILFTLFAAFSDMDALLFLGGAIVFTLLATIAHTLAKIGTQIWEMRRDQRLKDMGPENDAVLGTNL